MEQVKIFMSFSEDVVEGEANTWLRETNGKVEVVERKAFVTTLGVSDHCRSVVTIVLFYRTL